MRARVGLSSLYEEMNKFITHIERRLTITERPHFPVHQYHCCAAVSVLVGPTCPALLNSIDVPRVPQKRSTFLFFE